MVRGGNNLKNALSPKPGKLTVYFVLFYFFLFSIVATYHDCSHYGFSSLFDTYILLRIKV